MQHPELPVFAFFSAFLVIIPVSWHWRARNVAVLALMFWLSIANIIYGINSIVWAGNVRNPIPVWCDITTKIVIGVSYALPLCTMCICKHLEMVSSSRKVSYDAQDKRRRMIFESIVCFLVPMIFMALHYIVQGHRYDIFEDFGCQAAMYISIQAVFIIWFPQLLFSIITFIFGALALHNFVRRRLTFALHLQQSNSAMTTNHYLRLIAMALTEMIWCTSLTTYNLYSNVSYGLRPWISWADVHSDFSRVDAFTTLEMSPSFIRSMLFLWWTLPASSFIFFAFFGFGQEALKEYKKVWRWLMIKVFKRPIDGEKGSSSFGKSSRSSRLPRTLHLVNLKSSPSSSSRDYKSTLSPTSTSHQSHTSQSTITLALHTPNIDPSYLNKPITRFPQSKDEEASAYTQSPSQDPAPAYYTPYPCSYPEVYLASEHPATDDADTFTISTFSYYGGLPSPSSPSSHRFELTEPSPTLEPHGLSPPPVCPIVKRPIPRDVPDSVMEESPSSPSSLVPQDVVESLHGRRTMNIPGGGILVTVQKQASIDRMV